jgi:hypothetical protein
MKIQLLIMILGMIVFPAHAQDFSISPLSRSIDITFNSQKGDRGWSNPYVETFEITVINEMNLTISLGVIPFSNNPSYVSVSSSKSSLSIPPLGSGSVTITVKVVDSAADGGRYSGGVRFSGDLQTKTVDVKVETHWPPPTLVLLGDLDFGELRAGNSYSRSFTLVEIYGFRRANNVNIKLNEAGPMYSSSASPAAFSFIDSSGRSISISFRVKERNIVPGTYTISISVSSTNNADLANGPKYTISRPIVEIKQPQNELIFDYGEQEKGNQIVEISESGGKTPLENTSIYLRNIYREFEDQKKEFSQTTWFSFPDYLDYIPPGGSKTLDISIIKPRDAPVGKYTWEGNVRTKYAGEKPFQFSFSVRPPDIDSLKNILIGFKSDELFKNYPQAESLISTTESLLVEDERKLADIANIISLTNAVIKFFNSSNEAYMTLQQGKSGYGKAYEKFRESNEEINELNNITLKQIYEPEETNIRSSAAYIWREVARLLISALDKNANLLKDPSYLNASYAEAKRTHEKIGSICSWLNDAMCVQEQNSKVKEMNTKIEDLISENVFLKNELISMQEEINNNTWILSGIKLLKNPFRFLSFLDKYYEMIRIDRHILRNHQLIEDQVGFFKTEENLAALEREFRYFRLVNSIYNIFLGIALITTAWKSIIGFIKYRADAKDMELSRITQLKRLS